MVTTPLPSPQAHHALFARKRQRYQPPKEAAKGAWNLSPPHGALGRPPKARRGREQQLPPSPSTPGNPQLKSQGKVGALVSPLQAKEWPSPMSASRALPPYSRNAVSLWPMGSPHSPTHSCPPAFPVPAASWACPCLDSTLTPWPEPELGRDNWEAQRGGRMVRKCQARATSCCARQRAKERLAAGTAPPPQPPVSKTSALSSSGTAGAALATSWPCPRDPLHVSETSAGQTASSPCPPSSSGGVSL